MKAKDLLVPVIGIGAILVIAATMMRPQQVDEEDEAELLERIGVLQGLADAGAEAFPMPDSDNLDPAAEYLNAFLAFDGAVFQVTIFDAGGISDEMEDVSETALQRLVEEGGWLQSRYRTTPELGGGIFQYTRPKQREESE